MRAQLAEEFGSTGYFDAFRFEAAITTTSVEQSWLRGEASLAVRDLRTAIAGRNFVAAREAVIVLSIVFDATTCRAIASLLDAMPRYSLDLAMVDGNCTSFQKLEIPE